MPDALLEICVDSLSGLQLCDRDGVDRIEIASALDLGGLTPTAGMIEAARYVTPDVRAMIRPRAGDFRFSREEVKAACVEIEAVGKAGLEGVVLGAALPGNRLDVDALAEMLSAAKGLGLTLHRVIDTLDDPMRALDEAIELGFDTVLTSGGGRKAIEAVSTLSRMAARAGDEITIMAGSGITAPQVARLAAAAKIRAFHASCAARVPSSERLVEMGFAAEQRSVTDISRIDEMVGAVNSLRSR